MPAILTLVTLSVFTSRFERPAPSRVYIDYLCIVCLDLWPAYLWLTWPWTGTYFIWPWSPLLRSCFVWFEFILLPVVAVVVFVVIFSSFGSFVVVFTVVLVVVLKFLLLLLVVLVGVCWGFHPEFIDILCISHLKLTRICYKNELPVFTLIDYVTSQPVMLFICSNSAPRLVSFIGQ